MVFLFLGKISFENNIIISKLIAYAGFVLIFPFFSLFSLGFSGICLSMFDLSQSKRLLALLGTGEIIASIIAYLIIPIVVKLIGSSSYLFIFSAVFSILSIVPIRNQVVKSSIRIDSNNKDASNVEAKFNVSFILYEIILANPELLYNKKYEFDGSDTIDYGLPIIKSIYTDTKEFYKFKDGDDICMHGYNPHPHKCISFSGNESKKLLHWPAKECRFDNTESGCKLHQKVNCAFLHKKTLIKCPGISICHQIDFQIIGYERGRSPVVYFNGFKKVIADLFTCIYLFYI